MPTPLDSLTRTIRNVLMLQHSRKASATFSHRQRGGFVVPVQGNDGVHTMFIIVIVAFILIKSEISIRPGINADIDGICLG